MTLYERLEAVGTPELMCPKCGKVGRIAFIGTEHCHCAVCRNDCTPIEVICLTRAQVDAVEKERGK